MAGKRKAAEASITPEAGSPVSPSLPSPNKRLRKESVIVNPNQTKSSSKKSSSLASRRYSQKRLFKPRSLSFMADPPEDPLPVQEGETISPLSSPSLPVSRPPPPTPFPWIWRCHSCGTVHRLACTRRCLRCAHVLCGPRPKGKRRQDSGPCHMEFDYCGWAAWGSWRRQSAAVGGDTPDSFSTHELVNLGEDDRNNNYGGRVRNGGGGRGRGGGSARAGPPISLWQPKTEFARACVTAHKEKIYLTHRHDCSIHCDYPSECHNARYSAAKGRARMVGQRETVWFEPGSDQSSKTGPLEKKKRVRQLASVTEENENENEDAEEDKKGKRGASKSAGPDRGNVPTTNDDNQGAAAPQENRASPSGGQARGNCPQGQARRIYELSAGPVDVRYLEANQQSRQPDGQARAATPAALPGSPRPGRRPLPTGPRAFPS